MFLAPDPHQQGLHGSTAEDAVGYGDFQFKVNTSSATALSEACKTSQWSFLEGFRRRNSLIAGHAGIPHRVAGGWMDTGLSYALVAQRGASRQRLWEEGAAVS